MEQNIEKERFYPPRCTELLRRFEEKEALRSGKKLQFLGVNKHDVYNISAPFRIDNTTVIAGRVEAREAWADSHIIFFKEEKGVWIPVNGASTLRLEDGFATHIKDETIFGGVEVYPNPATINSCGVNYRTVFYRGRDFLSLQKFAVGPDMMKNIRLAPLANGLIGLCTRPK
ncbi:MAG: DUF1861 family protein, partial [Candidatus Subteraquimicrobiales bacterium]|nr:DUF1861 family protein [Candidatus Subteraquimicrobiales bacterium]